MEIKICRHLDLSFVQFRPHLDYHVSSSAVIRIFYVKFRRRHLDISCQDAPPSSGCFMLSSADVRIIHFKFRRRHQDNTCQKFRRRHLDFLCQTPPPSSGYFMPISAAVIRKNHVQSSAAIIWIFSCQVPPPSSGYFPPPSSGYCMSRCATAIWILHVKMRRRHLDISCQFPLLPGFFIWNM